MPFPTSSLVHSSPEQASHVVCSRHRGVRDSLQDAPHVVNEPGIWQHAWGDGIREAVLLALAARSTYIKVRCEGDRTLPLFSEDGDSNSASFSSKPLILVIIHSDAVATIKVRDKKEGAQFYGQVGVSTPFPILRYCMTGTCGSTASPCTKPGKAREFVKPTKRAVLRKGPRAQGLPHQTLVLLAGKAAHQGHTDRSVREGHTYL